jgi:hypothetical protein
MWEAELLLMAEQQNNKFLSQIHSLKLLQMPRLSGMITPVALGSLWRSSLIEMDASLVQLSRRTSWRDLVLYRLLIQKGIIVAFINSVRHERTAKNTTWGDAKTFHHLNQSGCYDLNNVSNSREYAKTRRAMDVVGLNSD